MATTSQPIPMTADDDFLVTPFPDFEGDVFRRGQDGYAEHCYQYASSSHGLEGIVQPSAIIYAASDKDVINAITYAKAKKIAVAVRTGGHQYSGASSTYGDNIQLDLSNTYVDFKWENDDHTLVEVGISYSLKAFNEKLGADNRFVPHGQCSHVHLGGHVQTGGYGQLGRSFGLLADHVQKLKIITADGQLREIVRDAGPEEDKDLFFAVLGGSPGNFGVLTHVTLRVHKDTDHTLSRGLKAIYLYDRDRLKRLLDIMVEMVDNKDFPADYDYCITMLSSASLVFPSWTPDLDGQMRLQHPELYGTDGLFLWPPMIVVYAQWANLEGPGQTYDMTFFNKIKQAGGIDDAIPFVGIKVNDTTTTPISKLTTDWVFQNVREYELPYVKRTNMTNSMTLAKDGWTGWVCNQIHEIQSNPFNGCKLSVQIQNFGGNNSRFYLNGLDGTTSFSWRDSSICCVLDCFYYQSSEASKTTAEDWQQRNDKQVGQPDSLFCKEDRRVLWGSYDLNLDSVHQHYYDDDPTKYERLCSIKDKIDPKAVFTPNGFCVGAQPIDRRISNETEILRAKMESASIAAKSLDHTQGPIKLPHLESVQQTAATLINQVEPHVRQQAMFLASMTNDHDMAARLRLRRAEQEKRLKEQEEKGPDAAT